MESTFAYCLQTLPMSRLLTILCLLPFPLAGSAAAAEEDVPSQARQAELRSEVAALIDELDSDQYEVRRRAGDRLTELIARPELGRLLAAEFYRALVRPEVSFEVRWHLERWSRGLPKVLPEPAIDLSSEQLDRLIRQLDDDSYGVRLGALRRLEWLLFQDEHLPRVQRAIRSRAGDGTGAESSVQLRKLLELCRPAMVAEYWQGGRNLNRQHLIVGVPSQGELAARPSHFDHIDDKVAHCVSGNNLSPGDYPVGVAFPHPHQPGAFFHLVNLPTPRRRMHDEIYAQTDEAQRLAAISRRTLDRRLAEKRQLSEPELIMLAQLDPKEVSRFSGKYFRLVDDTPLPPRGDDPFAEADDTRQRPSRLGMICAQLALSGTKEATPGLLEAIDQGRFLPPTSQAPYRFHWLAALAIAIRDPWPGVDAWLAGKIPVSEIPVEGRPNGPQLGATAAAILLTRHRQSPLQFGLQSAAEPLLLRLGIDGYRFPSAETRKKVQQWWESDRKKTATAG